jgi:Fe(3+) dicitrate transport protein
MSGLLNFEAPFGFGLNFAATYISQQFTDELNTIDPASSGEIGIMPSYLVLNLTGNYNVPDIKSTFYISIKNLLNKRYIASRRPQGIKVGLPRFFTVGFELTLYLKQ